MVENNGESTPRFILNSNQKGVPDKLLIDLGTEVQNCLVTEPQAGFCSGPHQLSSAQSAKSLSR